YSRRTGCPALNAVAAAVLAASWAISASAQTGAAALDAGLAFEPGDWPTINGDYGATRFSPLEQIDRGNVARLAEAWTYELNGSSTAVPLVVAGIMYVPSGDRVVALDGDTGEEIWAHTLRAP